MYIQSGYPTLQKRNQRKTMTPKLDKIKISPIKTVHNQQNTLQDSSPSLPNLPEMHISRRAQKNQMTTQVLTNQHLEMLQQRQNLQHTLRSSKRCSAKHHIKQYQQLQTIQSKVEQSKEQHQTTHQETGFWAMVKHLF